MAKHVELDGKIEYVSRLVSDKFDNSLSLRVIVRQTQEAIHTLFNYSDHYYGDLMTIKVLFYPDISHIKSEYVEFHHPASKVISVLSQEPLDRISEALEYQVNSNELNKLVYMSTHWDESGVLDKRSYTISKSENLPLNEYNYINQSAIRQSKLYDVLIIKF